MALLPLYTMYFLALAPDLDSEADFCRYAEAYAGIKNSRVVRSGKDLFLYFDGYGSTFDPVKAEDYLNAYYQRA